METESSSIQVFGEYLNNLRAVNLYVSVNEGSLIDPSNLPLLSVISNVIEIPRLGNFKIMLKELVLLNCSDIPPRTLESNILCYRLVVKPDAGYGSAAAEIVSNFERTVDEGAKNLVKNSINNVALKEGTLYQIICRFCNNFLSDLVKFDRIRPLPSKNWVENAHELWYCHPPEPTQAQGTLGVQDMSSRLNKINLVKEDATQTKSIVDLLKCPEINYCFYGPCNWALNKDVVKGIVRNDDPLVPRADCKYCKNELGSFTSDSCVKIWDFGAKWVEKSKGDSSSEPEGKEVSSSQDEDTVLKAIQNFKSIVFATIYELSDHPTFRFTVSSTVKGNSVFLWNIDRNLSIYQQLSVPTSSSETVSLDRCKVAKFFFAVRENNILPISDPREVLIIQESEQNEQSILTVPDYVYRAGIGNLKETSKLYSRNEQTLQCGYLVYEE